MNYYIKALKNYAKFDGRATRPEFWYFILFNTIIQMILSTYDKALGLPPSLGDDGLLKSLYDIALLLPSIAVSIRRMHDVDRKGWFILIPFYNLYLFCQPGTAGDNRFGPNPPATPAPEATQRSGAVVA